ncbi:MAG: T9SS type A sorting domain-containing protein [Flavobacteriales bacterium]
MNPRIACLVLFCSCASVLNAQITVLGQAPNTYYAAVALETNGVKFVEQTPTALNIYDPDLTLFRSIPLTPLPGFEFSNYFQYITEALFDTDPSTIEFIANLVDTNPGPPTQYALQVIDETGSALLTVLGGALGVGLGIGSINEPIFTTDSGTYMITTNASQSTIYQLPGHLPCDDCSGSLITGGGDHFAQPGGWSMQAYPNPSDNSTVIQYELPAGSNSGDILFFNNRGQQVFRIGVEHSGQARISTEELAAGTYLYQLHVAGQPIGAQRLMVVR